jgi:hypothetical protein
MTKSLTTTALALAMAGAMASAAPVQAASFEPAAAPSWQADADDSDAMTWNHGRRHRGHHDGYYGGRSYNSYDDDDDDRYEDRRNDDRRRYDEPVYRGTRVWRGDDGRSYCRRSDGTTGLLIGGAAGALLGREVAGYRGDRTLGAILGAAGGALIGREIDRGGSRCR